MNNNNAQSNVPTAPINVTGCLVGNNPGKFGDTLPFKVEVNASVNFNAKVLFQVKYCGASSKDQVLLKREAGPFQTGKNHVILKCNAPNPRNMTRDDVIGNGLILIEGVFNNQRFVNVGYFVNNEYLGPKVKNPKGEEVPPKNIDLQHIKRSILTNKPKVTRFDIRWRGPPPKEEGQKREGGDDIGLGDDDDDMGI